MQTTIHWVDARWQDPVDGDLVLAAVTGRYPADEEEPVSAEQDFWLVLPMHFRSEHVVGPGQVLRRCYLDADRVLRTAVPGRTAELVTHWALLPALPGSSVSELTGASVGPALGALRGPTG